MERERERERVGEREREEQINRVRDRLLGRNENGVGKKWLLVKIYIQVFLVKANQ